MERQHTFRAIDKLKCRAFRDWCGLLAFGESREEEGARLRYNALVDLSNAWTR
jgi:hypothetical protein